MKKHGISRICAIGVFIFSFPLFAASISTVEELSPDEMPFQYFNLKTNALFDLNKNWNATMEVALDPHWAVGVSYMHAKAGRSRSISLSGYSLEFPSEIMTMEQVSLAFNYYFSGTRQTDAFFLSPTVGISLNTLEHQDPGVLWRGDHLGYVLGMTANYQVMWENGLNLQLGLGFMKTGPNEARVTKVGNPSDSAVIEVPTADLAGFLPVIAVNAGISL